MKLAARIRVARRKAGLSQQKLAAVIGVQRSAVANWESVDGAKPAIANLILVATTTHVCFDWLATGRGEMQLSPYKYDSLVVDAELIEDPGERRLLRAWRRLPAQMKVLMLELAEAYAPAVRKPSTSAISEQR
jgi:transcriptional regulator with XRE-family HTH domain